MERARLIGAGYAHARLKPAHVTTLDGQLLRTIRPASRLLRTALRYGAWPWLLLVDVIAWSAAIAVAAGLDVRQLVLLPVLVMLYQGAELYRARPSLSILDDAPRMAGRVLAAAALTGAVAAAADRPLAGDLLVSAGLFIPIGVVLRAAAYAALRALRARGHLERRVLILGSGGVAERLAEVLLMHREYGLHPLGFLDSDPVPMHGERIVPVLGSCEHLPWMIEEFGVGSVVVAFGSDTEADLVEIIRTCDQADCELYVVPRLFELSHTGFAAQELQGVPVVRLRRDIQRGVRWRLKRVMDLVAAAVALLLLAPLLALCMFLLRLESGPGTLFRQVRVGLNGRRFEMLKFRTLEPSDLSESATLWSVAHDGRVRPFARFLRRTSLDELPQLWNILLGHMSLVGPRPERPHFVARFANTIPRYADRHRVRPGLTGWAQVNGLRGDTSLEERVCLDNCYIENWSLWTDVKVLLRTVSEVLWARGS
jgi:exopolysaccharide biosynthesis polyprenyl glycosylphosphotransferase